MKQILIKVDHITKKFKKIVANKDIAFDIYEGDRIAIIGANGSGKTTLVEQLVGISSPTKGKINYNFKYETSPQEKMGIQFQDSSYPDGLSVKNIINFSLKVYRAEINPKELKRMYEIFQIDSFLNKPVKGISGGQQQKLNVLLAVIHKPEIIILDEISTGLDIAAKTEIFDFVEDFLKQKSKTAIITSHNMDEVKRFTNRVIVLKDGILVKESTPQKIEKEFGSLDQYMNKVILKKESHGKNK